MKGDLLKSAEGNLKGRADLAPLRGKRESYAGFSFCNASVTQLAFISTFLFMPSNFRGKNQVGQTGKSSAEEGAGVSSFRHKFLAFYPKQCLAGWDNCSPHFGAHFSIYRDIFSCHNLGWRRAVLLTSSK